MCIYANMFRTQNKKTLFTIMITQAFEKINRLKLNGRITNTQIHCLKSNRQNKLTEYTQISNKMNLTKSSSECYKLEK